MNEDYIYYGYTEYHPWLLDVIAGLSFGLTWMVIASVFVVTFFILAAQYQKSVFGNEGYLTNTLPIKTEKVIIAKMLNFAFWNFIAILVGIICVFIMFYRLDWAREVWEGINEMLTYAIEYGTWESWFTFGVYVLIAIINSFSSILMVFFAMAIGSQFKHKLAMGVGAYFGISMISSFLLQIIYTTMWLPDMIIHATDNYDYIPPMFRPSGSVVLLLLQLVLTGCYFYGTYYIQKKKLNLE